jgi:phenylacetate-coenzyme A ligase PaaK-like adenylate-forming protein
MVVVFYSDCQVIKFRIKRARNGFEVLIYIKEQKKDLMVQIESSP